MLQLLIVSTLIRNLSRLYKWDLNALGVLIKVFFVFITVTTHRSLIDYCTHFLLSSDSWLSDELSKVKRLRIKCGIIALSERAHTEITNRSLDNSCGRILRRIVAQKMDS